MDCKDIVHLCLELGAHKAESIPVSQIVFQEELRKYCEDNRCGRYARNYTCPPMIGEVRPLINKLQTYPQAVIWQNIYQLEDSFDIEGMMAAQEKHNAMTLKIARKLYECFGRRNVLVLAAGGCTLCKACACLTSKPCLHPEDALSSLEAYGIHVAQLEAVSGMKYINGPNTVTYFSGAFC